MTPHTTELVRVKDGRRHLRRQAPTAVEISGVSVRPAAHFTRAWSATGEAVPVAFRMSVLPVRGLALFVLWAASSPQRLAIAAALSGVVGLELFE
ncbi:hypothetical protein K7472_27320 [Streptomyces sp. PTM05]|uniref:Uncharacterized protein n=1 Tax=Streptantibioticus parmotrematis TaxID=2873249 RepID=A0ABS7R3A6_9ACTN|nr:hypothetical protein [Streptantibioticus parmotrematis]MBY8888524.1 hypothetical protein [Streptantibioticus parmotrematis]